ncbi:MAG: hypothetical protein IJ677_00785 [Alphaproteobacteria bacterium]|nr:hypothetical protein [Alphaproteobacteria bacterium]
MLNNQSGRSMLEMLGVLSIIGVLSVGGISGYSKMTERHKINSTMQQINIISAKLSAIGAQTNSYGGLDNESAVKFNAVPYEVLTGTSGVLVNPFGGSINIFGSYLLEDKSDEAHPQAYAIKYSGLSQEACISLASSSWNNSKSSSLLGIGVGANAEASIYQGCPGTTSVACPDGSVTPLPMDISKARVACNCKNNCVFVMKFF